MNTKVLTQKEKELIAVGASISGGCVKCSNYHFKQAFEHGANKDDVHQAVLAATSIIESSVENLQRTAYCLMNIERQAATVRDIDLSDALTAHVMLASAVAANNVANVKKYIGIAGKLGSSPSEIHLTVKLARVIQKRAGEFVDEAIADVLQEADTAA